MRARATAATARGNDVDAKAGLPVARRVSAAVVRREQLDVLVKVPAVSLIFDSVIREMHLAVEERQVVVARPVADLTLVAAGSAVAVGAVAVVVLQELLVLALEVLFEDDAPDVEGIVLVSEPTLFLPKRCVEVRVVVDRSRAAGAGVEQLRRLAVAFVRVRIEEVAAVSREGQSALAIAQLHRFHESLIVQVFERTGGKIQI